MKNIKRWAQSFKNFKEVSDIERRLAAECHQLYHIRHAGAGGLCLMKHSVKDGVLCSLTFSKKHNCFVLSILNPVGRSKRKYRFFAPTFEQSTALTDYYREEEERWKKHWKKLQK